LFKWFKELRGFKEFKGFRWFRWFKVFKEFRWFKVFKEFRWFKVFKLLGVILEKLALQFCSESTSVQVSESV
jgi:hypothetical protein